MASKEVGYCHAARATSQSAYLSLLFDASGIASHGADPKHSRRTLQPRAPYGWQHSASRLASQMRRCETVVKTRSPEAPRAAPPGSSAKSIHAGTPPVTRAWLYPLALSLSSPVQLTGLRSAQWWPSYYLSYYPYLPACRATSLVLWLPRHPTMLCWLGYLSLQPQHYMYDMRPGLERCSSYCQVDVFVLIGGEHGTLFVDYLTTSPLLTSDAGCNIYIDWYHTSPKATHLALVVHHESEDCATPTQRCIQSLLKEENEKKRKVIARDRGP